MSDKLCRFQNVGYCKYKEKCDYKHVTEVCNTKCDRKTCQKRHLKFCRYGFGCRRQTTCEFKHIESEEAVLKSQVKELETTIKKLMEENKKYVSKLEALQTELRTNQSKIVQENKEKDKTIRVLKEKLNKEEEKNDKNRNKIEEKEQELKNNDTLIRSLREKVEKNAIKTKGTSPKRQEQNLKEKCRRCGKVFNGPNLMKVHLELHHGTYQTEITRQKVEIEENEGLLKCDKCGKKFTEQSVLEAHMELRHREANS